MTKFGVSRNTEQGGVGVSLGCYIAKATLVPKQDVHSVLEGKGSQ